MHPLVREHLEKIIVFLEEGVEDPDYRKYTYNSYNISTEEYSILYDKADLYGKIALSINAMDWLSNINMSKFIELSIDYPHFVSIYTVIQLLYIKENRIKNTHMVIEVLESILKDSIRENIIDEILL